MIRESSIPPLKYSIAILTVMGLSDYPFIIIAIGWIALITYLLSLRRSRTSKKAKSGAHEYISECTSIEELMPENSPEAFVRFLRETVREFRKPIHEYDGFDSPGQIISRPYLEGALIYKDRSEYNKHVAHLLNRIYWSASCKWHRPADWKQVDYFNAIVAMESKWMRLKSVPPAIIEQYRERFSSGEAPNISWNHYYVIEFFDEDFHRLFTPTNPEEESEWKCSWVRLAGAIQSSKYYE